MMRVLLYAVINAAALFATVAVSAQNTPLAYTVEYAVGADADFEARGTILMADEGATKAKIDTYQLTSTQLAAISTAAAEGDIIRLRVTPQSKTGNDVRAVVSYVQACALVESKLMDSIRLHLSFQNSDLVAVEYSTKAKVCSSSLPKLSGSDGRLRTRVIVERSEQGTQVIYNNNKQPNAQRQQSDASSDGKEEAEVDDRSFFGKYWHYILMFVITMNMRGAPDEDEEKEKREREKKAEKEKEK